jgi:hypothetical protein
MTREEALARARVVLEQQHTAQVVRLNPDGSLGDPGEDSVAPKKTILHDKKGEYSVLGRRSLTM